MLRRNVLVFHSGALGDFVLTWPLALALSRLWPQSRIIYVTQKQKGLLAEKALRVEWTDAESGWHHLHGNPADLPEDSRKKLQSAHAIFPFAARPDDRWIESVRQIAGSADVVPVSVNPPENWTHHASEYLLQTLAAAPAVQSAVQHILSSIAARGVSITRPDRTSEPEILLHPGGGSPEKCWPLQNFLHLAEKLTRDGRPSKFLLGEVERDRWPATDIKRLESAAPVADTPTYLDLLTTLSKSDLVIANDTGPAHLAAIIGTPTLTLFGPTNPAIWAAQGPRVTILHRNPLKDLPIEEVEQATRQVAAV